jgi:phospholipase A2
MPNLNPENTGLQRANCRSGSCWLQILYFSTITDQSFERLLTHLKHRLGVHITYPPDLLKLITSAPTNKFLLSGAYEKYRGLEDADFGLVDAYGIMLGARLLVPKGELAVDEQNLKLSNQRKYVDGGAHPLPIYTAVRHEIPDEEQVETAPGEDVRDKAKKEAWFQWFE